MKYRVLTIAREYGSGGAEIAGIVASSLGWRLVDKVLLSDISNRASVPVAAAAALAKVAILEAYCLGNCVIVGRGSQCVLQTRRDVFHAFVYARWADRLCRVHARVPPGTDVSEMVHTMDRQCLDYVRRHYGENRLDPHLYDLMIDSHNQSEAAARLILLAVQAAW